MKFLDMNFIDVDIYNPFAAWFRMTAESSHAINAPDAKVGMHYLIWHMIQIIAQGKTIYSY